MKQIYKILSEHKYAIIWTICYIFVMWAILLFMFNFDMFDASRWHKLMHAELHGFGGFVFGILMLAALPLYIATTTLIVRNKKPLITIPTPRIASVFKPATAPTPAPKPAEPDTPATAPEIKIPDDMPPEMHDAFIRTQKNIQTVPIITPPTPATPVMVPTSANDMASAAPTAPNTTTDIEPNNVPLPSDFDIETPNFDDMSTQFTPVFQDINFDEPTPAPTPESTPPVTEYSADTTAVILHMANHNRTFDTDGDIVITDTHAIATHNDSDFWIADNDTWFASGKTRHSPIARLKEIAATSTRTPVLYLATTNIMDLDKLIPQWQNDGITVITDLTQI